MLGTARDLTDSPPPQISMLEEPFLSVNCDHLHRYNRDLYSQLVRYPQEVIPTFDMATNELFSRLYPGTALEHQIQVPAGLPGAMTVVC